MVADPVKDPLMQALAAVRELRAKVEGLEQARHEPVAIVGMGCRLPGGVGSPDQLWQLLASGVDAIGEVPPERWDTGAYYHPDPLSPGRMVARHGGFLDRPDAFDAFFFGISPREAREMDPQQRLFLEVAWEALEDAGIPREALTGSRTGVFVGANACDFLQMQLGRRYGIGTYTSAGGANSLIPNRLSYLFDLRGPSLTIDSACSSSLVAVHLAVQSLRSRESDSAVVGGLNLMLLPTTTLGFSKIGALAPDGRCKTFDSRADGYVRSEGVTAVVLKRLSDAVAAGDRIWAVVRECAVNQDGLTNGLTAPNGVSQRQVIEMALQRARLKPSQVTLIEAHGTGTALGDPIEVEALREVYGKSSGPDDSCALGSIKSNLGHLEAGSGLAGLVKAALSIHYRQIAPNLHLETLNPHITLDGSRLSVPTQLRAWEVPDERRYAAISAFGAGGTNAHALLGPAPVAPEPVSSVPGGPVLLPISARTGQALLSTAAAYRDFLTGPGAAVPLTDIARTASVRRTQYPHRLAVVAGTHGEAAAQLESWLQDRSPDGTRPAGAGTGPSIAFVFAGHGTQRIGMGRELMDRCPAFRQAVLEVDEALAPHLGESVVEQIHRRDLDVMPDRLTLIQPALFAIGVGLAARWRSLGVTPDVVAGHSMGEITASYVAGALTLEDAARIICVRSELLQRLHGSGSLLAVGLPMDQAAELLDGQGNLVSVAVSNGPTSTVLSGDTGALIEIGHRLADRKVLFKLLEASVPGHGPAVEKYRDEFLAGIGTVRSVRSRVPILSTVRNEISDGSDFDADYWYQNLRRPVLFWPALQTLAAAGHRAFIEISPHPMLTVPIEQAMDDVGAEPVVLASLRRDEPEEQAVLEGIGTLHSRGTRVLLDHHPDARCVSLPTYSWQHERFPLPAPVDSPADTGAPIAVAEPVASAVPAGPAPAGTGPVSPGEVYEFLIDAVAEVLDLPVAMVEPGTGFFQLGMDSMMAVRMRRMLEARYQLKLPIPVVFEFPSVDQLSGELVRLLAERRAAPPEPGPETTAEPAAGTTTEPAAGTGIERAAPDDERSLDELSESELVEMLAGEMDTIALEGER